MRKSSVALMTTGIIIGTIVILWQFMPLIIYQRPKVTWTDEANEYWNSNFIKIITVHYPFEFFDPPEIPETRNHAEEIARSTDLIVHLIDLRVGLVMVWWSMSQSGGWTPGRFNWTTAWQRLILIEEIVGVELQVDWSFEAVKLYWNPGDPYYGVPDQPDFMIEVLRLAAYGETEFRALFANATAKAEELANATDKVVDLADLIEAIVATLH